MKHFLANEWDKTQAQKRGGGKVILSIDFKDSESKYAAELLHDITPDKLYERRWAMTVLEQVMATLRKEILAEGKIAQFDQMKIFLMKRSRMSKGNCDICRLPYLNNPNRGIPDRLSGTRLVRR